MKIDTDQWIRDNTKGAESVIELGCGKGDRMKSVHPGVSRVCGLDIHKPYVSVARKNTGCLVMWGTVWQFYCITGYRDVVMLIDVLEHLHSVEAGLLLINLQCEFNKILLCVPEGNHPQTHDAWNMGGEYWQTHKSTWYRENLENLGFRVEVDSEHHNDPKKDRGQMFAIWEK